MKIASTSHPGCPNPRDRTGLCGPVFRYGLMSLVLLAIGLPSLVAAADLRVRVFERGGKAPLTGVSVCLGTPANIIQFGTHLSDAEGYVVFRDVPRAPLVVTASMQGYKGEQESLLTSSMEQLLILSLTGGGGGPECTTAGQAAAAGTSGLQVGYLKLNQGASVSDNREVTLNNAISGNATHYRASEQAGFTGAEWLAYETAPVFTLSEGNGRKLVHFQVRRYSRINGADIQTLSPVVTDSIILSAP